MKQWPPIAFPDTVTGKHRNANPSLNQRGSWPDGLGYQQIIDEICNVVTGAGIELDGANSAQLLAAILALLGRPVIYVPDTGTADALSGIGSPAISAYATGQLFLVNKSAAANATATPTINVGGLGAKMITKRDGAAVAIGDLSASIAFLLAYDGTNFRTLGMLPSDARIATNQLTAPRSYYVNASAGSDSNDGLTTGAAFASIQKAVTTANTFNLNGYTITINVADGAYGRVVLPPVNGSGAINLIGNTGTPYNCVLTSSAGSAVVCSSPGYTMNGFRLACSGTVTGDPGSGLWVINSAGVITMRNINWGAAIGAQATIDGGQVILGAAQYSSGSAFSFAYVIAAGKLRSESNNTPSFSVTTPLTYASCFLLLVDQALSLLLFTSISGAGSVTGAKYNVQSYSLLDSQGMGPSAYPGSAAGVTSTGGNAI